MQLLRQLKELITLDAKKTELIDYILYQHPCLFSVL